MKRLAAVLVELGWLEGWLDKEGVKKVTPANQITPEGKSLEAGPDEA